MLGQQSIGIVILSAGFKHEKGFATFKIISCRVSDMEFPLLPVLPQPATEDDV